MWPRREALCRVALRRFVPDILEMLKAHQLLLCAFTVVFGRWADDKDFKNTLGSWQFKKKKWNPWKKIAPASVFWYSLSRSFKSSWKTRCSLCAFCCHFLPHVFFGKCSQQWKSLCIKSLIRSRGDKRSKTWHLWAMQKGSILLRPVSLCCESRLSLVFLSFYWGAFFLLVILLFVPNCFWRQGAINMLHVFIMAIRLCCQKINLRMMYWNISTCRRFKATLTFINYIN